MSALNQNTNRTLALTPLGAFMFAGIYVVLRFALDALDGVGQASVEGIAEVRDPEMFGEAQILLPYFVMVVAAIVALPAGKSLLAIHRATKSVVLAHVGWLMICVGLFVVVGEPFIEFEKTAVYGVIDRVSVCVPFALTILFFAAWWKQPRTDSDPVAC